MICDDVVSAVREGRSPLVLTERTEHLRTLAERLSRDSPSRDHAARRHGQERRCRRPLAAAWRRFRTNAERVLLATGRFIGEGFDDPRLDTLFLALPVSWRGTIAQYVGRLHRLHEGKREVRVYDYADLDVPMLARMFDRRCRGYEAVGYTILLPASAVPGWPADVPLPIDPEWKQDYAASVRRLIRDGVDAPLANLFVHAARIAVAGRRRRRPRPERHRSLSCIAGWKRLPETAGRFRLNAELPIPFDDRGQMEVDFLCAEAACGDRTGRRAAPGRPRGLSARPAEGCAAAGERLFRAALPGRGCRQAPRPWSSTPSSAPWPAAQIVSAESRLAIYGLNRPTPVAAMRYNRCAVAR